MKFCKQGKCERITVNRLETQRTRMRKMTDKGTDVGLILEPNIKIHNGDVVYQGNDRMIVVELEPERVALLTFNRDDATDEEVFQVAVKIGHAIGNLHRPIMIDKEEIIVPIQAESESIDIRRP